MTGILAHVMRRAWAVMMIMMTVLVSCAPSSPPNPVAAPPTETVLPPNNDAGTQAIAIAIAIADAGAAGGSPCERLRAEQTAASEQARSAGLSAIAASTLAPARMPCSTFADGSSGAWGIIARVASRTTPNVNAAGRLTSDLVAVLKSGARKEQQLVVQVLVGNAVPAACEKLEAFDYDGDGTPEVLATCSDGEGATDEFRSVPTTTTTTPSPQATPAQHHVLWTMRDGGGEIQPYAAARGFVVEHLRDVDGDGRPDLEYSYFTGRARRYIADPIQMPVRSPLLIAHALTNGTFAKDDDVAIRAAKELCPKRPGTLFAPKPSGGVDVDALVHNVACARFWGATHDGAIATVKKECDAHWKRQGKDVGREHDPCLSTQLIELYASDPPLRLK